MQDWDEWDADADAKADASVSMRVAGSQQPPKKAVLGIGDPGVQADPDFLSEDFDS
jgi:hypothetical protein